MFMQYKLSKIIIKPLSYCVVIKKWITLDAWYFHKMYVIFLFSNDKVKFLKYFLSFFWAFIDICYFWFLFNNNTNKKMLTRTKWQFNTGFPLSCFNNYLKVDSKDSKARFIFFIDIWSLNFV